MKKSKFTEEQIAYAPRLDEASTGKGLSASITRSVMRPSRWGEVPNIFRVETSPGLSPLIPPMSWVGAFGHCARSVVENPKVSPTSLVKRTMAVGPPAWGA